MKLNLKALALSLGIVWGMAMLLTGIANMITPGYGDGFLRVMESLYPGYKATPAIGSVVIGTLYGLVDGAVGGLLIGWIYNAITGTIKIGSGQ